MAFPSFGIIVSFLGGESRLLNKLVKGKLAKGNIVTFPSLGATGLSLDRVSSLPNQPAKGHTLP